MSSSKIDNEARSQQKKFIMHGTVVYEALKDHPDMLRAFAATFLPVPGYPPPMPNADDAISITYRPQVAQATTGSILHLEPTTFLLPRGAAKFPIENQDQLDMINLVGVMISGKIQDEVNVVSDRTCWGCKKTDQPKMYFYLRRLTPLGNSSGVLTGLVVAHYAVCFGEPKCNLLAQHASLSLKDSKGRHQCNNCKKREDKPFQFEVCQGCKLAVYCSQECQTLHWPKHKKVCKHLTLCEKCGKMEGKPGSFMKCGRCISTPYCSKECQLADWKIHKKTCKPREQQKKKKGRCHS